MNIGTIVVMGLVSLTGLLGLFAASRAVDAGMYVFGFVLFVFAVLFDFWMIKHHFDSLERAHRSEQ